MTAGSRSSVAGEIRAGDRADIRMYRAGSRRRSAGSCRRTQSSWSEPEARRWASASSNSHVEDIGQHQIAQRRLACKDPAAPDRTASQTGSTLCRPADFLLRLLMAAVFPIIERLADIRPFVLEDKAHPGIFGSRIRPGWVNDVQKGQCLALKTLSPVPACDRAWGMMTGLARAGSSSANGSGRPAIVSASPTPPVRA